MLYASQAPGSVRDPFCFLLLTYLHCLGLKVYTKGVPVFQSEGLKLFAKGKDLPQAEIGFCVQYIIQS